MSDQQLGHVMRLNITDQTREGPDEERMTETEIMEAKKAEERFERRAEQDQRRFGFADTDKALCFTERLLPRVIEEVEASLASMDGRGSEFYSRFVTRVKEDLSASLIALCGVHGVFLSVAAGQSVVIASIQIGRALADELLAAYLHRHHKDIDASLTRKVRRKYGSLKYRKRAFLTVLKKEKLWIEKWTKVEMVKAGGWLLNLVLKALPDIFELASVPTEYGSDERFVTVTDYGLKQAHDIAAYVIRKNPVYLPQPELPAPWRSTRHPRGKGSIPLIRSHRDVQATVKAAIASGQMQPVLDALNAIQSTPFVVNKAILDVQFECLRLGIVVDGLPGNPVPLPPKDAAWEDMSGDQRKAWRIKAAKIKEHNMALVGQKLLLTNDHETAQWLANKDAFYVVHSLDWRGRVYPISHFNFQREDRVRSLFLFRDGEPIGEEGLRWLKIHTANCGDFDKVSKRGFEERVAWVDAHMFLIRETVKDPFQALRWPIYPKMVAFPSPMEELTPIPTPIGEGLWWTKADKPFLFLAACMELVAALDAGPSYVTHLPVSWDGSCSGLQHLCAMSRAEEGSLVNLTPSDQPRDVYQTVAEVVKAKIAADDHELAAVCLAAGIDRKLVKRNVMTYNYSAGKFGMANQLMEDKMDPLALEVLEGHRDAHPFGDDNGLKASVYLAGHIYSAIESAVHKPAQVMTFLQKLSRAMAHEEKPVRWITPVGLPWINSYHPVIVKEVYLWLHDRGVKVRYRADVAVDEQKPIDKRRASNGIAPNFVHACDAAHLMLTVNAAYKEGINHFALVHDSFGCLASQSTKMHRIIREQFVLMYEQHDVLAEVLEQSKCALIDPTSERLPDVVQYGSLNIKDVLNADYAFA